MDPSGLSAVLLPDPGLWGPAWTGHGTALEAWGLEPVSGPGGPQPGPVRGRSAPPAPPGPTVAAAQPLLLPLLPQVPAGSSAGHDSGTHSGSALHIQEVEGPVRTRKDQNLLLAASRSLQCLFRNLRWNDWNFVAKYSVWRYFARPPPQTDVIVVVFNSSLQSQLLQKFSSTYSSYTFTLITTRYNCCCVTFFLFAISTISNVSFETSKG